jgi:hypothetical protein
MKLTRFFIGIAALVVAMLVGLSSDALAQKAKVKQKQDAVVMNMSGSPGAVQTAGSLVITGVEGNAVTYTLPDHSTVYFSGRTCGGELATTANLNGIYNLVNWIYLPADPEKPGVTITLQGNTVSEHTRAYGMGSDARLLPKETYWIEDDLTPAQLKHRHDVLKAKTEAVKRHRIYKPKYRSKSARL